MPASSALPTSSLARSWLPTLEMGLNRPSELPNVIAPRAKRDTINPVSPSRLYCTRVSPKHRPRDRSRGRLTALGWGRPAALAGLVRCGFARLLYFGRGNVADDQILAHFVDHQ